MQATDRRLQTLNVIRCLACVLAAVVLAAALLSKAGLTFANVCALLGLLCVVAGTTLQIRQLKREAAKRAILSRRKPPQLPKPAGGPPTPTEAANFSPPSDDAPIEL